MSTDFNEDLIIRLNQLRGNESFILDLLSSLNSTEQVSEELDGDDNIMICLDCQTLTG